MSTTIDPEKWVIKNTFVVTLFKLGVINGNELLDAQILLWEEED